MKKLVLAAVSALSLFTIPLSASAHDRDDGRRGDRWEDRREGRREFRRRRGFGFRAVIRQRRWVTYVDARGCVRGYWAYVNVPVGRFGGDGDGDEDDGFRSYGYGNNYGGAGSYDYSGSYDYNGYDGQ